jgi:hypothetical protein
MPLADLIGSTEAMREIFDARAGVQAMLDVEAALACAHAATGAIAVAAAEAIAASCDAGGIDPIMLATEGAHAGTIVIPLVAWLRAQVSEHAASVHRASTSQDIIDTVLVGEGIVQPVTQHRIEHQAIAQAHAPATVGQHVRRAIHVLHAAGDRAIDQTHRDILRRRYDSLRARTADAVHRHGWDVHG